MRLVKYLALIVFVFIFIVSSYILYVVINLDNPVEASDLELGKRVEYYIERNKDNNEDSNSPVVPRITGLTDFGDSFSWIFPLGDNRLLVPKIGLDVGILTGDESVLRDGLWHRLPPRGNPVSGGNFILSGHRFGIGNSIDGVKRNSPLFNIDNIEIGDRLSVIWDGEHYQYEVYEIFKVAPNQIEIESASEKPILTLYTCTLEGAADGRDVIKAKLL